MQLTFESKTKDSILYSVNTDGFYITKPKIIYRNKKDVKLKIKNIGNAYVTNSIPTYFGKHYRENMDINDYTPQIGDGCIYYGEPGCNNNNNNSLYSIKG